MITLIDEDRMVLKNYEHFGQVELDNLACYIVEYEWSLDRKPIISFFTLEENQEYNSDII